MDLKALREKPARFVVGLMSGTSCDGVDAALVRIKGTGADLHMKFIRHATLPYPQALRSRLMASHFNAREICLLNFELGELFAEAVLSLVDEGEEGESPVDFVASHGHTIAHVPPRSGGELGTLQVGEPAVIAERTGLPVVSDFRTRDMAAGGLGAPLVPYADWVLFHRLERTVVCLNIGGIANFTVVTPEFADVFAFDIGPGNMAVDGAVQLLMRGMQQMDEDGALAAKGTVIPEFLDFLLSHKFFKRRPPKSTGREEFGPEVYLRDALATRKDQHSIEDLVATVTASVGYNIVGAYNGFVKTRAEPSHMIVSGGGAYNKSLLRWIRKGLPDAVVNTSDEYGLPSSVREAVAFAILGNETIFDTPANVLQATGAKRPVVLGKITPN